MTTTVLGVDPGTATTGYGVIFLPDRDEFRMENCGTIRTPPEMNFPDRLKAIHDSTATLLEKYSPDAVAVESLYFSKNAKTAFAVGQARGVIVLAAAEGGYPLSDYSPLEVKKALTGDGNADKKSVQKMVTRELGLEGTPRPDDAADGLAIAITHVLKTRFQARIQDS